MFKVAGTIDGNIRIKNDHITIAGQTAPGNGITIKGEYLNGTVSKKYVDYTKPENNVNTLK